MFQKSNALLDVLATGPKPRESIPSVWGLCLRGLGGAGLHRPGFCSGHALAARGLEAILLCAGRRKNGSSASPVAISLPGATASRPSLRGSGRAGEPSSDVPTRLAIARSSSVEE